MRVSTLPHSNDVVFKKSSGCGELSPCITATMAHPVLYSKTTIMQDRQSMQ